MVCVCVHVCVCACMHMHACVCLYGTVTMYIFFITGQLESEFYIERYSEGDHTVSLILTGSDGSSKRFDKVFTVETLRTSASQASQCSVE